MIEPYYVVAVAAMRDYDDEQCEIMMYPVVVHPDPGQDPAEVAIRAIKVDGLLESDGWRNHHATASRLDLAIVATIEADKTAVPNELRIVRYAEVTP